jgi:hypothetical protein
VQRSTATRPLSALVALALVAAGAATLTAAPASAAAGGALVYGLTTDNKLVSFRAETPGSTISEVAITGLQAGEDVVGIDVRPATGELYAVGSTSRVYVVNPTTGAATLSGAPLTDATGGAALTLSGAAFGVDFNPVPDRLRVVSDAEQNLRINVATGSTIVDGALAYAAGDAGAGSNPAVTAAGYTNNVAGTTTTTLYDVDTASDVLVTQNPPNAGTLNTVGSLGIGDVTAVAGFDVAAGSGTAYAALTTAAGTGFYTVNLTTGAATLVAAAGRQTLEDISVATARVGADDATATEGGAATVTVRRTGDVADPATVDYATSSGTATEGSDFTRTTGTVTFAAGETSRTVTIPTTNDGAVEGVETLTLTLSNLTGGAVFTRSTATVRIADDEEGRAYGLTSANQLVTFDVRTPGTVSAPLQITGVQAGEDLVGLDVRPANGELFVVGSTSRLYVVEPTTGVATQRGAVLAPALSGTTFGVDFNPTVDRLRIVSNTGQNLRINPDTAETFNDTALAYGGTDAGTGTTPRVAAAAYTNSFAGAATTALFDVETARDVLVQQNPANAGTLTTIGALGVAVSDTATVGLDIASAGNAAFAVFTPDGATAPSLYRVSLETGAATVLGALGNATVEDLALVSVAQAVTPTPSPSASPSATATATRNPTPTLSPTGSPGCTTAASVALERTTITATGSSGVTVRATANSVVDLFAYSRPSTTYRVVRSAEVGADGVAEFRIVPPTNTRLYAQQRGCDASPSVVLNVRTQLSLNVVRNGTRNYTFSGRALPARNGGLIVSLYRVTANGNQILTAQTRANASTGVYSITRQFTGSGRFGFVVRTGQDLQNGPGASNVRSLLVF